MDPERSRADERGPAEGVAERARPAARASQEFPRNVEESLMSHDNILHKVRTALGRGAGQSVREPPEERLRVPEASLDGGYANIEAKAMVMQSTAAPVRAKEASLE